MFNLGCKVGFYPLMFCFIFQILYILDLPFRDRSLDTRWLGASFIPTKRVECMVEKVSAMLKGGWGTQKLLEIVLTRPPKVLAILNVGRNRFCRHPAINDRSLR